MKKCWMFLPLLLCILSASLLVTTSAQEAQPPQVSSQTQLCLGCHTMYTPGIVADWRVSRHAATTPEQALSKSALEKRMSAAEIPGNFMEMAVGCYECHGQNPDAHQDSFTHMGMSIHVVVTPQDCQTCHPAEVEQYAGTKKAMAYTNLLNNPVYHALVQTVTGVKTVTGAQVAAQPATQLTLNDVCLGCHGTKVEVQGLTEVQSKMGPISVPNLVNWPNQGVGRVNPDGSVGACTSCHSRHGFSIAEARKPYTCSQCHAEPDVPAWPVYKASKHGNIFEARQEDWDFHAVPWKVGQDFQAPTCAACHNSLLVGTNNAVIAERTHDFGARLYLRIFGLIYSHPQPKSGDTTILKNADGLSLPTTFTGAIATEGLIDEAEQNKRRQTLKTVCQGCHATQWTDQHFHRFEHTVAEADQMVLAATQLLSVAWDKKLADNTNPFDETVEQLWVQQWLFYANTVRYASAMTGAYEYAGFKNGWWDLTHTLQKIRDHLEE